MYKLSVIIGTRPDIIRTSVLLKKLKEHPEINLKFIWTGQHYDDNLKKCFIDELGLFEPDTELEATGTPLEQHWKLIKQLSEHFSITRPDACLFLGDTNAVIGSIVPLKLDIPIIHIEAGMRSHDLGMPEEKNRIIIDRISDLLYTYQHDYKCKLVQEGICPSRIVVTGNTIVDVLKEYMPKIIKREPYIKNQLCLSSKKFAIQTLHRNEHMNVGSAFGIMKQVNNWANKQGIQVLMTVMPRLQKLFDKYPHMFNAEVLNAYRFIAPLGFFDFVALEKNALIEFTDSGTNQETSSLLGVPAVVTRRCTERPETFKSDITLMTETEIGKAASVVVSRKRRLGYNLGNGTASDIIINDIVARFKNNSIRNFAKPYIDMFRMDNWAVCS